MTSFEELYQESRELEDIGAAIQQGRTVGLTSDQIEVFVERYHHWFADAVSLLPPDLAERFRAEYEGSTFGQKIKAFLSAPTEISVLYRGDKPPTSDIFPYWQVPFEGSFKAPLQAQRQILMEATRREPQRPSPSTLQVLEQICRRFPDVAAPLLSRKRNKPSFTIDDEYDVQDLLHGLLRLFFDDVRPEERMPSHGGASATVDFLLKREHCLVEAKFARPDHRAKEIGEELAVDIERYRAHPDRGLLVVLIYDPGRVISNPNGFEADLSGQRDEVMVAVFVST